MKSSYYKSQNQNILFVFSFICIEKRCLKRNILLALPSNLENVQQVNCKWSAYKDWSPCSVSCGGGVQTKIRRVIRRQRNGGKRCRGKNTKIRSCGEASCQKNSSFLFTGK